MVARERDTAYIGGMLLVVDVGNTNTVLGLYEGKELVNTFRIESAKGRTVDEYHVLMMSLIQLAGVARDRVTASIVASVVPALSDSRYLCSAAIRLAWASESAWLRATSDAPESELTSPPVVPFGPVLPVLMMFCCCA